MLQFERRRGRGFAGAVEVRIGFKAVVEENVLVLLGISGGKGGQDQQANQKDGSAAKT